MSHFYNMTTRLIAQDAAIRRAEELRVAEAERVAAANYERGKELGHLFAQNIAHVSHLRKLAAMERTEGEFLSSLLRSRSAGFSACQSSPSYADEMARLLGTPALKAESLFGEDAPSVGLDHLRGFIAAVLDDWKAVQAEVDAAHH
ncbi:hypothetical protein [Ideonella dechloratans]|uniref:hypothetical protein n=1 Tax=Ideonella dechloratans TaxID=36863 RepID=UPI0035B49B5B